MKRPVSEDENEEFFAPKKPKMSVGHFEKETNLSDMLSVVEDVNESDESDESENDLLITDLKDGLDKMVIGFVDESITLTSYSFFSEEDDEEEEDYDSEGSIDSYNSTRISSYESDNNNDLHGVCPHCNQRCHAALGNYSDEDDYDDDSEDDFDM